MTSTKKRGLGRGLGDLGVNELLTGTNLSDHAIYPDVDSGDALLHQINVEKINPGRFQPRRHFNPKMLQELADSIRAQGVIQPIIVRKQDEHRYELIAGERRWRAAKLAGLTEIPALIKEINDQQAVMIALIENIQRRELNAVEEAQALQRLIEEFAMTHQQVADAIGKSRAMVTNLLRLLKLNPDVSLMVEQGELEMGHARALLAVEGVQQSQLAKRIVSEHLSVRETEEMIRHLQQLDNIRKGTQQRAKLDPDLLEVQRDLSKKFGLRVQIRQRADGHGKLVINYKNTEEFNRILEKMVLQ